MIRLVRVFDAPEVRVVAGRAERGFVHVELAKDYRTSLAKSGHDGRIVGGHGIAPRVHPSRRGEVARVDVVLDGDRHAVQGTKLAARAAAPI